MIDAAKNRWPDALLILNDIDSSLKSFIAQRYDKALIGNENFLEKDPFRGVQPSILGEIDVVLLNPPFSNLQIRRWRPRGSFSDVACSQAFAFLLTCLDYLSEDGVIAAILPVSCLHSDLDKVARARLRQLYSVEVVGGPREREFSGVDVSVVLITVRRHCARTQIFVSPEEIHSTEIRNCGINIVRGNISVKRSDRLVSENGFGWVHTTSLQSGIVRKRFSFPCNERIEAFKHTPGGSLLVPRVGRVVPGSISISEKVENEFISDCVFGISLKGADATDIKRMILKEFEAFRELYQGTGASYVTVEKLKTFIARRM